MYSLAPYPLVASNVYKPGSASPEPNSLKSDQFHSNLATLTMAAKFSGVMAAIGLLFVGIMLACTPAVAKEGSEGNLLEQPIKEVTELIPGDGVGGMVEDIPPCPCTPKLPYCCFKQALQALQELPFAKRSCECTPFTWRCCREQARKELPFEKRPCECTPFTWKCCRKQALKEMLSDCPCGPYTPWCC
ncbi:hypothetical protein M758_2G100200 [Ceratodon purpureus]|nr:hypothetical protein M758_2G100200 [Ceratodon purpureus]